MKEDKQKLKRVCYSHQKHILIILFTQKYSPKSYSRNKKEINI